MKEKRNFPGSVEKKSPSEGEIKEISTEFRQKWNKRERERRKEAEGKGM